MNLSVGVHKNLLFWTLYQGMALAVPWNRRKVWASAPVDPGKPQWLKPLTTDVAARLKPCPDTGPATEFHIYVAHPPSFFRREIRAIRVVEHQCADACLGLHHHALGELHSDILGAEQRE